MTEREEFEAWWMRDVPPEYRTMMPILMERDASGKYTNPRAEGAWEVWQASRRTTPDREAIEPTPMKEPDKFGWQEPAWRMDAYYYGFAPTGVAIIDRILSAVACAGKSFHHTQDWTDHCSPYEHLRGETVVDWIQNAANDAAGFLKTAPNGEKK